MASNSNDQAGGYDYKWVTDPSDELLCLICLCVARDPHQHGNGGCGKVFCHRCVTEYQRQKKSCPICRKDLTTFKDERSARHIKSLKVRCNNLGYGCEWTGELGELETHLQSCDHTLLPCTNECKNNEQIVKVLRMKDLSDHLTNKCPRRQYQCPHCEEVGEYQERVTSHLQTCPKVKVRCPNPLCRFSIPRCEVSTHRSTCDYEPVPCKYAEVGCKERPLRKNLVTHEQNSSLHLKVTVEKVLELSKIVLHQQNQMQSLVKVLQLSKPIPFTFKMTNFGNKKSEEIRYFSPPFYSSQLGYRMCASVHANGNGNGKGTHVSVYVRLMKGEHDDSLTWPFTGTVTIELLNQLEDKNHHKSMEYFQVAPDEYQQRVVDGETGKGWGSPKFITHADLANEPSTNCHYLVDDCLSFRVTVETS